MEVDEKVGREPLDQRGLKDSVVVLWSMVYGQGQRGQGSGTELCGLKHGDQSCKRSGLRVCNYGSETPEWNPTCLLRV